MHKNYSLYYKFHT